MNHTKERPTNHSNTTVRNLLLVISVILITGGLFLTPHSEIIPGVKNIVLSKGTLLSDYFVIGGTGPALINAGFVMLISIAIIMRLGLTYNGLTIATTMIVAGFSLFGKNFLNIIPILIGNWLYSVSQKEKWRGYIYIGLFSTCLSPFVSQLSYSLPYSIWVNITISCLIGVALGFFVPPLAAHTPTIHLGYNLFNVGFAGGILAWVTVAFLNAFGINVDISLVWSKGINPTLAITVYLILLILGVWGFLLSKNSFKPFLRIFRHSGRAVADFIVMDGIGPTFLNMSVMGIAALTYIIVIGGDLNGPTLGSIITVTGFAAFGMHLKNCAPITVGVVIASLVLPYSITDPSAQLAAIYGLALAPIAGQFGAVYGIITGIMQFAMVSSVSSVYSGLNLYNNGFSAGIVAMVMIPIIESFRKEQ